MASGKASRRKRAAQQARVAAVAAQNPRAGARRWVLLAALAAVAVAVAIGVALAGGSAEAEAPTAEGSALPEATEAAAIFRGIPQRGTALGRPSAPVTVVEFLDLQCPFCREFAVDALPTVIDKHVRTGKVRIELRGLAFLGPDSERGLRAALAAGNQGSMFEFTELLYYNQGPENAGWLSQDLVESAARSVPGLDVARLVSDMDSGSVSDLVDAHRSEAERRGVDATPTIFVGPTGGELKRVSLSSPSDVAALESAIAAAA
jgi:protein-disulfide isomerase